VFLELGTPGARPSDGAGITGEGVTIIARSAAVTDRRYRIFLYQPQSLSPLRGEGGLRVCE